MSEGDAQAWPRRPALPAGLLGAVLLGLMIEWCLFRDAGLPQDRTDVSWYYSAELARLPRTREASVLCLGDSQMKFGVIPRVITERTKRSAVNLAAYCGTPITSYLLLRRVLASCARPDVIVFDSYQVLLNLPPEATAPTCPWPHLLTWNELLEVGIASRSPLFFGQTAL